MMTDQAAEQQAGGQVLKSLGKANPQGLKAEGGTLASGQEVGMQG